MNNSPSQMEGEPAHQRERCRGNPYDDRVNHTFKKRVKNSRIDPMPDTLTMEREKTQQCVALANTCSVGNKLDEVGNIGLNSHIMALTETWLEADDKIKTFAPASSPIYRAHRNDGRTGAGVPLLVRNYFKQFNMVDLVSPNI